MRTRGLEKNKNAAGAQGVTIAAITIFKDMTVIFQNLIYEEIHNQLLKAAVTKKELSVSVSEEKGKL